jgi:hypothetical protein
MKNSLLFSIFITVMFSFLNLGCEKAEIQKSSTSDNQKISGRWVDECGDCPNWSDCCGRIELISGEFIQFETCGTADGDASTCTDEINGCLEIDGLKNSLFTLDSEGRLFFCMEENHSFIIKVFNFSLGGVVINITCQVGSLSPQSINVPITATGTYTFTVNDECEISVCP